MSRHLRHARHARRSRWDWIGDSIAAVGGVALRLDANVDSLIRTLTFVAGGLTLCGGYALLVAAAGAR